MLVLIKLCQQASLVLIAGGMLDLAYVLTSAGRLTSCGRQVCGERKKPGPIVRHTPVDNRGGGHGIIA